MIVTKILNDTYFYMSSTEFGLWILAVYLATSLFVLGIMCFILDSAKQKKKRAKEYLESLNDKEFRKYHKIMEGK